MKLSVFFPAALAAVALAGCASGGGYNSGYGNSGYGNNGGYSSQVCNDCGTVTRIMVLDSGRSAPTATGAVLGGLVGAVAAHEIADHTGGSRGNKNVAAVAGAAAGALAGNRIQQNTTGASYDVTVRMDDGRVVVVNQKSVEGFGQNSQVRVVNGRVVPR